MGDLDDAATTIDAAAARAQALEQQRAQAEAADQARGDALARDFADRAEAAGLRPDVALYRRVQRELLWYSWEYALGARDRYLSAATRRIEPVSAERVGAAWSIQPYALGATLLLSASDGRVVTWASRELDHVAVAHTDYPHKPADPSVRVWEETPTYSPLRASFVFHDPTRDSTGWTPVAEALVRRLRQGWQAV